MKSGSEISYAKNFGHTLSRLMHDKGIGVRDLVENLKDYVGKAGMKKTKGISSTEISQIKNGNRIPSQALIKELARIFDIREEWLLCRAGITPFQMQDHLSENPDAYFSLLDNYLNIIKIGVAEILWAAPILAVPTLSHEEKVNTQFECMLYETGQEAIKALLDGHVQFATVTSAAVEKLKGYKGIAEIYYVLDFFTSRLGSLYYLYKLPRIKSHKTYAYISGSVVEDVAKEYAEKKNDELSIIGVSGATEISERIVRQEIQGFFGWPPLDDKISRKIKGLLEEKGSTPSLIAKFSSFSEEEIPLLSDLIPSLYLISTNSVISNIGAAKLTDLVSRILDAREKLNGALVKQDYIASILSNYMNYLSDKTKDKLKFAMFDANIEANAFKFMIATRGHWATTSQWSRTKYVTTDDSQC